MVYKTVQFMITVMENIIPRAYMSQLTNSFSIMRVSFLSLSPFYQSFLFWVSCLHMQFLFNINGNFFIFCILIVFIYAQQFKLTPYLPPYQLQRKTLYIYKIYIIRILINIIYYNINFIIYIYKDTSVALLIWAGR